MARGSLINVVAMASGAALTLALTVLVSRWLQPAGTGALFELIALFTIASNTLELGADTGLMRWISRARAVGGLDQVRRLVAIALLPVAAVGTAAAVAIWVAAPELARIFLHGLPPGQAVVDIRIVAPLVPLGALSACLVDGTRGFGRKWPYLAIEGLGKPVARIILVLCALLAGLGLQGAVVAWGIPVAAGLAAISIIFAVILRSEVPARPAQRHRSGQRGALLRPWGRAAPSRPLLGARRSPGRHRSPPVPANERSPAAGHGVLAVHRSAGLPGHLPGDHNLAEHLAGRRADFAARGGYLRRGEQAGAGRRVRAGGDPARDQPSGQWLSGPR